MPLASDQKKFLSSSTMLNAMGTMGVDTPLVRLILSKALWPVEPVEQSRGWWRRPRCAPIDPPAWAIPWSASPPDLLELLYPGGVLPAGEVDHAAAQRNLHRELDIARQGHRRSPGHGHSHDAAAGGSCGLAHVDPVDERRVDGDTTGTQERGIRRQHDLASTPDRYLHDGTGRETRDRARWSNRHWRHRW